jgi:hypothetical protein
VPKFYLRGFFKYFFRVLHEVRSLWLKFLHAFQKHSVLFVQKTVGLEFNLAERRRKEENVLFFGFGIGEPFLRRGEET